MKMSKSGLIIILSLVLGGCGESGWIWEDLTPDPIPPQSSYWVKPGMTKASRINDWVACGGNTNGNTSIPAKYVNKPLSAEALGEINYRHYKKVLNCMKSRGYHKSDNPVTPSATTSSS